MALHLGSHHVFRGLLLLVTVILVDLDLLVPSCGDDREVVSAIPDEGDLAVLVAVWVQLVDHHPREDVGHFDLTR